MISLDILGIVVFFVCFFAILLSFLAKTYKNWIFVLVLIVCGFSSIYALYSTYERMLGYSTPITIPNNSFLISYHIDEPNWIYVLVIANKNAPRLHRIEYDREIHENLEGLNSSEGMMYVWQTNEQNHGEFVQYDFSIFNNQNK